MWRLRTVNPTNKAKNPNHLRWLHDGAFGATAGQKTGWLTRILIPTMSSSKSSRPIETISTRRLQGAKAQVEWAAPAARAF